MEPIRSLAAALEQGSLTARDLIETSLERIEDPAGEGSRAFISTAPDRARAEADRYDAERAAGRPVPAFAGIPVGIKDLADVAGEVTTAGTKVLADRPRAGHDAVVVARLRAAGFIPVGRTNMTEFAFSGLGLNEHYDTPAAPWDRANDRRIPGGSSSGSAVAVADGMVAAGLGTDTGGSCRIPAAYCGITGYKPTASRVPVDGIVALSPSLDSVGPLARTVDCCAIIDDVFAGGTGRVDIAAPPVRLLRLAAINNYVTDDLDPEVAQRFEQARTLLVDAGVVIDEVTLPELDDLSAVNAAGGLAAPEAYSLHGDLLEARRDDFDFRVGPRIQGGAKMSAPRYLWTQRERERLIASVRRRQGAYDAFVMPTVANLPPTMASFGDAADDGYMANYIAKNVLSLRNTSVANFLDGCSISLPIPGDKPVGLMLMSHGGDDHTLLAVARAIEAALNP